MSINLLIFSQGPFRPKMQLPPPPPAEPKNRYLLPPSKPIRHAPVPDLPAMARDAGRTISSNMSPPKTVGSVEPQTKGRVVMEEVTILKHPIAGTSKGKGKEKPKVNNSGDDDDDDRPKKRTRKGGEIEMAEPPRQEASGSRGARGRGSGRRPSKPVHGDSADEFDPDSHILFVSITLNQRQIS
jgi:hypothetical protein